MEAGSLIKKQTRRGESSFNRHRVFVTNHEKVWGINDIDGYTTL